MTRYQNEPAVALVQLPFPNQADPLPQIAEYYRLYAQEYESFFPEYRLNEGDLWEAPLWIAHMDGAIGRDDTVFIDLSRCRFDVNDCVKGIKEVTDLNHFLFFSPLVSNLGLAKAISQRLITDGYQTVIGGNATEFASPDEFSVIFSGLARAGIYQEITSRQQQYLHVEVMKGRNQRSLGYHPRYRHVQSFGKRVPLVRISASHGCLFACAFCGDAWSQQLHEVELEHLRAEVAEIRATFPDTHLVYIGDKTFGQSRQAVENLQKVLLPEYKYRIIVQTHVSVVNPWLIDAMHKLGVEVVEMGFESANSPMLRELKKKGGTEAYYRAINMLNEEGFKVILNVLGGLPNETPQTHQETLEFLTSSSDDVWLYNLYNFVPYPKTPLYPVLKERIVDWNFDHWREDQFVVFTPYHQSREELWAQFLELVDCASSLVRRRQAPTITFDAR